MSEAETLLENLVLLAASKQSGTDVTPIRLCAEIRREQPAWPVVFFDQTINDLDSRALGQIRAPQDDPGEREFFIDYRGVQLARQIQERRRPKSLIERARLVPRSDWIALGALVISVIALFKS